MKKINNFVLRNIKTASFLTSIIRLINAFYGISLVNFIWVDGKVDSLGRVKRMEKGLKLFQINMSIEDSF